LGKVLRQNTPEYAALRILDDSSAKRPQFGPNLVGPMRPAIV
jgi:hypothetical protein